MLILAFDVVNQAYVPNYKGSAAAIGPFRQGKYSTRLYLVQPVASAVPGTAQYEEADDLGNYEGLRVGTWSNSTGTLDDEDAKMLSLTDQTGWTTGTDDDGETYFSGTLDFHTQEMAAHIAGENSKAAYFAVNRTIGAVLYPVYDHRGGTNVTILSATDAGGGVPLSLADSVPTINLPCEIYNPATGNRFSITENASGSLEFSRIS